MANKCEFRELPDLNKARNRTQSFSFDYEGVTYPDSLVKYLKGKTYFIHTYGCQANYRDEEVMAGMFEHMGMSKASGIENADVVVLNTCAVRENAEQKVFGMIGELKKYKITDNSRVFCVWPSISAMADSEL